MSGIRFIDTDCNGYFNVSSVYGIRGTCKENFVGKTKRKKVVKLNEFHNLKLLSI